MTTLVAINTRDAIVMGSDSLGTVTKQITDPHDLAKSQTIPSNYYSHVEKIFSLAPLEMGVMCSGVGALGDRSLKSLIGEFSRKDEIIQLKDSDYTLFNVGESLLQFLWEHYHSAFPDGQPRPDLELMLCGYDKQKFTPGMVRIYVQDYKVLVPDYDFCIFFGGITREIQRLIFGTDMYNKMRLIDRSREILGRYHDLLIKDLESQGVKIPLKRPEDFGEELELFHDWHLEGLAANWGAFSERMAIECTDFLINLVIKSQEYSTQAPSVGGEVQIALVQKYSGFRYISRAGG